MNLWGWLGLAWIVCGGRNAQPSRNPSPTGFGYGTVVAVFLTLTVFSLPFAWALTAWPGYGWALNALWATVLLALVGAMFAAVHRERSQNI